MLTGKVKVLGTRYQHEFYYLYPYHVDVSCIYGYTTNIAFLEDGMLFSNVKISISVVVLQTRFARGCLIYYFAMVGSCIRDVV